MSDAVYQSLVGRHVIVTGGADGIGASLVEAFCEQGSVVTFLDINERAAAKVISRTKDMGWRQPNFLCADLTDISALQSTIADAIRDRGPVRALINNAANDDRHAWEQVTSDYWDERIAVNLKHQFFAIQAVANSMAEAGGGSIVNFSSISWQLGMGGMPCYTAAKAAIVGLTRSFARDLGSFNIRVNTVLPGWILTQRQITRYFSPDDERKLMESQCLKRRLLPADVASIVLFLCSDASSACTSQSFTVDGGWS